MLLTELLTSPYKWTEKVRTGEVGVIAYRAQFRAGNRTIVVEIDREYPKSSRWEMAFGELREGNLLHNITGSGDEFRVFATVIKITREFIEKYDVDSLSFIAEKSDGSRVALYTRMMDRLVKGKWKYKSHQSPLFTYFTIKKA